MNWRALPYAKFSADVLSDRTTASTNWSSIQLSNIQYEKLKHRFRELFEYLQSPSFDEYFHLKTKGLHYRFVPAVELIAKLNVDQSELRKHLAASEHAGVRYLWDWVHSATNSSAVRLRGVVLESFKFARSRTNSVPHTLVGPVSLGFTRASEALNPGFNYATVPEADFESDNPFLHISFFARSEESGNVGPVYVSLQWLESDQQWAFSRLITDDWLGVRTLF